MACSQRKNQQSNLSRSGIEGLEKTEADDRVDLATTCRDFHILKVDNMPWPHILKHTAVLSRLNCPLPLMHQIVIARRRAQELANGGHHAAWAQAVMLDFSCAGSEDGDCFVTDNAKFCMCTAWLKASSDAALKAKLLAQYPYAVFNDQVFRVLSEAQRGILVEMGLAYLEAMGSRSYDMLDPDIAKMIECNVRLMQGIVLLSSPRPMICDGGLTAVQYAYPANGTQSPVMADIPRIGRGEGRGHPPSDGELAQDPPLDRLSLQCPPGPSPRPAPG